MSNSPSIDPRYWHVEGDLLAFLTYGDAASRGLVKLTTLPDCAAVQDFCLPTTSYRYDSVWDIAISPDRAKLAVLVLLHEIRAPLSGSTYQVMGKSCSLAVFDIATGAMSLCPRKAAHTLCWLPDSRTVLFHSLRDEKLHELTQVPKALMRGRNLRKRDNPFHDVPLFAYHLDSGVVEPFADTPSPHLAADANRLVFKSGPDALGTFNLGDNTVVRIPVGRTGASGDFAPSPDGRFSLVPLVLNRPVSYWGHPTIVDLHDPSRRYYFGPTIYRVVWARTDQVARGR